MPIKDTDAAYSPVSKSFHWLTALIIFTLLAVGFYMAALPVSPDKFKLYWLHKSFGILILMLVCGRILWRLANRRPADLPTHQHWERFLARFTHIFLYLLLIAMPLTGWFMSSAGDFPAGFFGLFELPRVIPKDENLFSFFVSAHFTLAWVIIFCVALHMAGAFKHHFIDRDETLRRMTLRNLGIGGGLALAALAGIAWALPVAINLSAQEETMTAPAAALTTSTAPAAQTWTAPAWTINKDTSRISFEATQYGEIFSGRFKISGGEIFFDPEDLSNNHVAVRVDITSISTGSSDRDAQAKSPDWFDAISYPGAEFTADTFRKDGETYIADGTLTIRGHSAPLSLPFTLQGEYPNTRMQASLSLNRLDFGIGRGSWEKTDIIGDAVSLKITLDATRE